jgi:hypothetical protein
MLKGKCPNCTNFHIFCTFCIYCFLIFIWRWGIWMLNFLLQWGIWRHILHRGWRIWSIKFQKVQIPGVGPGGMVKFQIDLYIHNAHCSNYNSNVQEIQQSTTGQFINNFKMKIKAEQMTFRQDITKIYNLLASQHLQSN